MDLDVESSREKAFYKALGAVPSPPAGMLECVERRVRQSGTKRRLALAACLLLAFIIPALVLHQVNMSVTYADEYESMEELLYAFEFLSGDGDDYMLEIDAKMAGAATSVAASGGADGGSADNGANGDGDSASAASPQNKLSKTVAVKERSNEK